jgi:hypothetical protein
MVLDVGSVDTVPDDQRTKSLPVFDPVKLTIVLRDRSFVLYAVTIHTSYVELMIVP